MAVTRLNHAVLYVRDALAAAQFYHDALGLETVQSLGDKAVFLRAADSANDHDLGLFAVGDQPTAAGRGLYHLAWEVQTLRELQETAQHLAAVGALVGSADHGASRSLYAKDLDGIEFEVMWQVPVELLSSQDVLRTAPLNLEADIARFGADTTARVH